MNLKEQGGIRNGLKGEREMEKFGNYILISKIKVILKITVKTTTNAKTKQQPPSLNTPVQLLDVPLQNVCPVLFVFNL